ncbi:MAG: type II toxin-antitoxin system Phd/YefM family antitoxin [Oscillospiraceae bacterium]|jgi:prevent-host-death family protein|nr:type II toxin-antitoxin system Phd/YefM family antitoxin [Oscillospiraceae bacterium]
MPNIRSSTDLRNSYNEISELCHERCEPIFITRNGRGDLAVMSIEAYDKITGRDELYRLLEEGRQDRLAGRTMPFDDAMAAIYKEMEGWNVQAASN